MESVIENLREIELCTGCGRSKTFLMRILCDSCFWDDGSNEECEECSYIFEECDCD